MKALMRTVVAATAVTAFVAVAQDDDFDFGDDGAAAAESSDDGEAADGESAEGEAEDGAEDGTEAAEGEETAEARPAKKSGNVKTFFILPYCRMLEGQAEVRKPGAKDWTPIQEGKFYPLGTAYRTLGAGDSLRLQFGPEIEVTVKGAASFGTRAQALDVTSRAIVLQSGTVSVKLPRTAPEGLFEVLAPGFKAFNLAGESRYTYRNTGDGDEAVVRCVTDRLDVEGRHWRIAKMRAADELRIRSSADLLFTGLYGQSGDCTVKLDQGRISVRDFETGETKSEDKFLDWKLSPQTAVRIHRALPALGERMSVTVMTFDAMGELKNRCAFAENLVEVNSGELGPVQNKDSADLAKRAAEATESAEGEAEEAEGEAEEDEAADGEAGDASGESDGGSDEEDVDF